MAKDEVVEQSGVMDTVAVAVEVNEVMVAVTVAVEVNVVVETVDVLVEKVSSQRWSGAYSTLGELSTAPKTPSRKYGDCGRR